MHRTSFLTALATAAAAVPMVLPPGRADAAPAAAADDVRAKLLPGQRLVACYKSQALQLGQVDRSWL